MNQEKTGMVTPPSGSSEPVHWTKTQDSSSEAQAKAHAAHQNHLKSQVAIFRSAVQTGLFHKVKFITNGSMLDYTHNVAKTILSQLEVTEEEGQRRQYWDTYRTHVNKALNDKRGNVNNEMKKEFMSTWILQWCEWNRSPCWNCLTAAVSFLPPFPQNCTRTRNCQ